MNFECQCQWGPLPALLIMMLNFTMTVLEITAIGMNTSAQNVCGLDIWYCLMTCAICRCLSGLIIATGLTSALCCESGDGGFVGLCINVPLLLVGGVWSVTGFYSLDTTCVELFTNHFSPLWTLLYAEVVMFYLLVGLLTFIILFLLYMCCH